MSSIFRIRTNPHQIQMSLNILRFYHMPELMFLHHQIVPYHVLAEVYPTRSYIHMFSVILLEIIKQWIWFSYQEGESVDPTNHLVQSLWNMFCWCLSQYIKASFHKIVANSLNTLFTPLSKLWLDEPELVRSLQFIYLTCRRNQVYQRSPPVQAPLVECPFYVRLQWIGWSHIDESFFICAYASRRF